MQERLKGSFAKDKNEILFSEFGINYNNEPEQFRKGTSIFRKKVELETEDGGKKMRNKIIIHDGDIIGDAFWTENAHLLGKQER